MSLDISKLALPDRIDHVGVGVKDAQKTADLLSSIWGLPPCPVIEISLNKDNLILGEPWSVKLAFVNLGPVALEVCEPLEGDSFFHRFLRKWGEGVNHIGFSVSNWDETVDMFKQRGIRMIMAGIFENKRWCYFETQPGGIVIEFMENYGIHNYKVQTNS
ncbi:VOC family protein [Chloroflexota bacterium]